MKILLILLFFVIQNQRSSFAQDLSANNSSSEVINKRFDETRIIKNISQAKAYTLILDSLLDMEMNARPFKENSIIFDKSIPCAFSSFTRNESLAFLNGQVNLQKIDNDVIVRLNIANIWCTQRGVLTQSRSDIFEVFWRNISTSLFIDGIQLMPDVVR